MFVSKNLTSYGLKVSILTGLSSLFLPSSILAQTNIDNLTVELCQKSIEIKVATTEDMRRQVEISFDTAERSPISETEHKIKGIARLRTGNNWRPLTYSCLVNGSEGLITQVNYKLDENELSSSIRFCQEELRATVKRDNNSNSSVEFNNSPETYETYHVSNTEEGVRGTFIVKETRNRLQHNHFDCTFNLREGRVTKIIYNPDSSNRPTANKEQIIWLCQDAVRQQVSQNQIDLGGILGISIGTGQGIEFGELVNTFDISDNQKRVEGNATLSEGPKQRQVNYKCTVNTRQGIITDTTIQ
ncbi:hypothetical protein RGRSB_0884 [cyanobacterium endosymbiont of Rhopalodia gibberula]|uniref:hypothetical protein n=1 Tax=cyanobacterium endosymbiont of Rhopalodia gibberula TaxID=1763363 RepID=UPI000DC732D3|nr:hypothetical protein [cyanobacterium endosymbiont of Rhopalodia gibberula]BBA79408.1 hypothetical protein RGRSB_0884 [cyanobacterium endosymbiont of Rhopalodia gibberula]